MNFAIFFFSTISSLLWLLLCILVLLWHLNFVLPSIYSNTPVRLFNVFLCFACLHFLLWDFNFTRPLCLEEFQAYNCICIFLIQNKYVFIPCHFNTLAIIAFHIFLSFVNISKCCLFVIKPKTHLGKIVRQIISSYLLYI